MTSNRATSSERSTPSARIGAHLFNEKDFNLLQQKLSSWSIHPVSGPQDAHQVELLILDVRHLKQWKTNLEHWRAKKNTYVPVIALVPRSFRQATDLLQVAELVDDLQMLPLRSWELDLRLRSLVNISSFSQQQSKRSERLLQLSENRHREIANLLSDYCYALRFESQNAYSFEWENEGLSTLIGDESVHQASYVESFQWLSPSGRDEVMAQIARARLGLTSKVEMQLINERWVRHYMAPLREGSQVVGAFAAVVDIHSAQQQLIMLQQLHYAADNSPNLVYLFDMNSGQCVFRNRMAREVFKEDAVQSQLFQHCQTINSYKARRIRIEQGDRSFEFTFSRTHNHASQTLPDVALVTGQDVTQRIKYEHELQFSKTHDILTQLPMRAFFLELLQSLLKARRPEQQLALVLFEFANLRNINESLGHQLGDKVLLSAMDVARGVFPQSTQFARVGGNEFAALIEHVRTEQLVSFCQALVEQFNSGLNIDEHRLVIDTSLGVALAPEDGEEANELFRHAESALRTAREAGGRRLLFFQKAQNEHSMRRIRLESELIQAFKHNEFCLYYQPQWPALAGMPFFVEALLRWQHPSRGLLMPGEFIDVLESSPLIHDVGMWVVEEACRQWLNWQSEWEQAPHIAVNVASPQFAKQGFVARLKQVLAQFDISPAVIELELTESTVMEDLQLGRAKMSALQSLGVSLALDDFGTGHSSLVYLAELPFDRLKIDRQFVQKLPDNDKACELVRTISLLGQGLGLKVVAEGVETKLQAKFLRQCGCHWLQGYWLSRPISAEKIPELMLRSDSWMQRQFGNE